MKQTLTVADKARLIGTSRGNLSAYSAGAKTPGPRVAERLALLSALTEAAELELKRSTSLPELAVTVRSVLRDGELPDRWVAEWVTYFRRLDEPSARALSLARPASTGHRGWDALLAGLVDSESYRLRVPSPAWTRDPSLFLSTLWLASPAPGLFAVALATTDPHLKVRGVLLPAGSLGRV